MPPDRRVVVMGLDGGTLDLVRPWALEGHLPHLARIMEEGCAAVCETTFPPVTASAWSSFGTGCNPGKHGLVDFLTRREGRYAFRPVSALDRRAPSLWRILSDAGRRVVVLNVPLTYPVEPVNGVLVSGLMTPGEGADFVHPRSMVEELHRVAGGYRIYAGAGAATGDPTDLIRRVHDTTERQFKVVRHLLGRDDWDFFMYVFQGSDQLQHATWHLMDPGHPRYVEGHPARHAVRDFYAAADEKIGWVMERLGEEDLLLIMSDHGAGPLRRFVHLNLWLMTWGLLRLKGDPVTRLKGLLFRAGLTPLNLYNHLFLRLGLGRLKEKVRMGRGGRLRPFFLSFQDVDWPSTRAYAVGNVGQIYLNLKGREPQGALAGEMEARGVTEELRRKLLEMRDPATGRPLVGKVVTGEEIYRGPEAARLPDVLAFPADFQSIAFGDYEFASNRPLEDALGITGGHRMEGLFLGWRKGGGLGKPAGAVSIMDLAPTILAYLGLAPPPWMDGRVLPVGTQPGMTRPGSDPPIEAAAPPEAPSAYSEAEEETIRKRLKDLGYLA
jgi:predicted AlkP superfamily phosphohydrolase/phosphomutase